MVKCKAKQDGLLPGGKYVYEDEVFEADKCPSWAEPVEKPVKKTVVKYTNPTEKGE